MAAKNAQRRGRRGDDDDDGIDFGEEGIDIDTYESNYAAASYRPEGDEEGAYTGPLGDERKRGG